MGGLFGGTSTPDNSAYERQLEEQRQATELEEQMAEKKKQAADAAYEKQKNAKKNTLLMSDEEMKSTPTLSSGTLLQTNPWQK